MTWMTENLQQVTVLYTQTMESISLLLLAAGSDNMDRQSKECQIKNGIKFVCPPTVRCD